jgi:hypothetical protein
MNGRANIKPTRKRKQREPSAESTMDDEATNHADESWKASALPLSYTRSAANCEAYQYSLSRTEPSILARIF